MKTYYVASTTTTDCDHEHRTAAAAYRCGKRIFTATNWITNWIVTSGHWDALGFWRPGRVILKHRKKGMSKKRIFVNVVSMGGKPGDAYVVNKRGKEVKLPATLKAFDGEKILVDGISQLPSNGKEGRVATEQGEFFPSVFGLKIIVAVVKPGTGGALVKTGSVL
jgi:hypothetical protein